MTLDGAINLKETADYIIYTMNSATTGQYGLVMPKNIQTTLNMLVDLHWKGSFDGVSSGVKTKEQLVTEIEEEYCKLKSKYSDGMLVMPMIDENLFQNIVVTGDKQKMFDEVKKIGAITSELYKKLIESGVEKQKIDQKIILVEKNQTDESFVLWLKEQMPNFVDGIRYSELNSGTENLNPFMDNNSLFGPTVEAPKVEMVSPTNNSGVEGGIFDNISPVVTEEPVSPSVSTIPSGPVMPIENTDNSNLDNHVDIFGIPTAVQGVDHVESSNGVSDGNMVTQTSSVNNVDTNTVSLPAVEVPKPVESSSLEGTTTFSPIVDSNGSDGNINLGETGEEGNAVEHTSKGFANLVILFVILIGVTIVSIELGKFLYNVYGV